MLLNVKMMSNPEGVIIPVASGKGGVGKTFVSANLAIALAEMGHRVIAVDLDLGGSNLHAFFGLSNRYPAISRALALQGVKTDLAAGLDAVLSELDGNGNHVAELGERTAVAAL